MTLRVKICGVMRADDARAAVDAGADAVGLIFAPGRRTVGLDAACAIAAALPPWFALVGVFRNAPAADVRAVLARVPLTHLQFHGDEPADVVARSERPAIKALPLCTEADEEHARSWLAAPAALLLDGATGGSGHPCDWVRAARLARLRPVVLAGGLTPDTVGAAVRAVRPAAVDVSSGVESAPGVKDHAKLEAFIRNARGAA